MRNALALLASLAVLSVAAGAQAASPSSLSIKAASSKVLYGHGVTLSGHLAGPHHAGRTVVIFARPYGSSAPHTVAAVTTTARGTWSHRVNPAIQTTYQAHIGRTMSLPVTVGVMPRLAVAELASGRVRVQVMPSRPFAGSVVRLQQPGTVEMWRTIARAPFNRAGMAIMAPGTGRSMLRAAMSVNQAGAGYLGAISHPFLHRAPRMTLNPTAWKVLFGHKATLTGRLANGDAGQRIAILVHPYGRHLIVRRTTTTAGGRFAIHVRPQIMTTYRARFAGRVQSRAVTIGMRPTIVVRELANGSLRTHVQAGTSFRGKFVKLQRMSGHSWKTVAKQPLNAASSATFTLGLPRSLVRVAMSVNQAGAGYLGSTSHPLTYRAL